MARMKIGHVAVDSGQLMICDPCYLDQYEGGEFTNDPPKEGEWSYNSVCQMTCGDPCFGDIQNGLAVAFSSGYGDGFYPVYAEVEDGRVMEVRIIMR